MNIDGAAIVRDRLGGILLTAVSKKWCNSRQPSLQDWLTGRRLVTEAPCRRRLHC